MDLPNDWMIHNGVRISLTGEGLFLFEIDSEKFKTSSFKQATEKIDLIKRKKRKPVQIPCWMVIDEGDDMIDLQVVDGEYCGIHAGWNAHTYRTKGDRERHAANSWRNQEVIFPTQEEAEAYASLLRKIEELTQECETVGFRIRRAIPGDWDARGRMEQEVIDYLMGRRMSPDVE